MRFHIWPQRKRREDELEEEIQSHLEMAARDRIERGETPDKAHGEARREFGNVSLVKDATRAIWGWMWVEQFAQDLRYGLRMLRRSPGFTAVAVLSLALGIGANSAVFSLIDALLLKHLPVKEPEQLYLIAHTGERGVSEANNFPLFEQMRDHSQSFSGLIAFNPNQWKVAVDDQTEVVYGQVVTGNYFSVLGVSAILGRTLTADDDQVPGGHAVAVISYDYWLRRFGRDRDVLGKTVTINLTPFTIVGVTAPEFFGLQAGRSSDISVPMSMHQLVGSGARLDERKFWWRLPMLGRLKSGVSHERAQAELDVLLQRFMAESGMGPDKRKDFFERVELISASRGLGELRRQFSFPLRVLMAIVAAVLLISCSNIANLLLARAAARRKEISIRLAIGSSRSRLVRQLLTESVILAVLGGTLGLLLAQWGARFLVSFIPTRGAPIVLHTGLDARMLSFTAAVSLLTGLLFGVAPALRTTRASFHDTLMEKKGHIGTGRLRLGFGKLLVAGQVAMSLVLLVGAALFGRSLQNLERVETGFDRDHILLIAIDCYGTAYKGTRLSTLHRELLEKLSALPGVRSASLSTAMPILGGIDGRPISLPGIAPSESEQINVNWVAPRYFETMGIPLVAGRDFGQQDDEQTPKVAVVSENMADYYFPNQSPLSRVVEVGEAGAVKIVGVVSDAKFNSLRKDYTRIVYLSHQQSWTRPSITLAVRTMGDPASFVPAVRTEIARIGKDVPIASVKALSALVDESLAEERMVATLAGFFGPLGLLVACVGLYGVMAHGVVHRTQEIGVRMALGANRNGVVWMVIREALALILIGVCAGLPTALAAARLISSLLFGLASTDLLTILLATLTMIAVAGVAGFIPARRGSRVDPMVALRYE
jgi:predicted permease